MGGKFGADTSGIDSTKNSSEENYVPSPFKVALYQELGKAFKNLIEGYENTISDIAKEHLGSKLTPEMFLNRYT